MCALFEAFYDANVSLLPSDRLRRLKLDVEVSQMSYERNLKTFMNVATALRDRKLGFTQRFSRLEDGKRCKEHL